MADQGSQRKTRIAKKQGREMVKKAGEKKQREEEEGMRE